MTTKHDFTIRQGETLAKVLSWYAGDSVTKLISAITLAFPPVLTAAAHGLPTRVMPCKISTIKGPKTLNSEPGCYSYALKLSTDTFSLQGVNASGLPAYTGGGYIEYQPPQDLTSYTARLQARRSMASTEILIDLTTTNSGITLGGIEGTITLNMSAADTAALSFETAVYDLELVSPGNVVTRLLYGKINLSREVTRDS